MERESTNLSRRDFFKGAALAGAGAAAFGLTGCQTAEGDTTENQGGNTTTSSNLPASWDQEFDVVVCGAGVGMAAGIESTEAGASTIILEAGDHAGGLWMTAGGSCTMGGGNVIQQAEGVDDTVDDWYAEEMWSNEYRGEPDIIRFLCEQGADTVKWMQDLGMIWELGNGVLRGPVKRGLSPAENPGVYVGGGGRPAGGICWTQLWEAKLAELGVEILLNTRMKKIYRDGADGPVVGVMATDASGAEINIKANRGVVLATGTWTDNAQMFKQWDPRVVGEGCYGDGGIPAENLLLVNSAGDGHVASNRIGAQLSDMSFASYYYIFFGSRSYWGWGEDPIDWTTNDAYSVGKGVSRTDETWAHAICVNGEGNRYVDESTDKLSSPGRGGYSENPEWPFTRDYLAMEVPRNVWMIGDSAAAETLGWPLDGIANANPRTEHMYDPELLAKADTIADLASQMGVDAAGLQATIDRYNGFVDSGVDEDFGKAELVGKIATAPFYGFKAALIRHTQRNGIRVNTKSQVLDGWNDFYLNGDKEQAVRIDEEPVIPRLYAAGELANSLGWRRPHNSLGHYVTVARFAGKGAAAEVPLT